MPALLWLLVCAALGGLIGFMLAGVNNRDTTAGAVAGTIIGGGIIALPMMLSTAIHAVPDWATPIAALAIIGIAVSTLFDLMVSGLFGRRRR